VEVQISPRVINGVAVLHVAGELDLYTSPKLKAALDEVAAAGHARLIVNLLEAAYLDSTALAILTAALEETRRAGGNLGLVFVRPQMVRLFTITGLNEVFAIFPTEAEALEAAQAWTAVPPQA
jgi:anti-sigma B factor antagonist